MVVLVISIDDVDAVVGVFLGRQSKICVDFFSH